VWVWVWVWVGAFGYVRVHGCGCGGGGGSGCGWVWVGVPELTLKEELSDSHCRFATFFFALRSARKRMAKYVL